MNITIIGRRCVVILAFSAAAARVQAQTAPVDTIHGGPWVVTDSALRAYYHNDSIANSPRRFYTRMAYGFAASIVLHEAAHYGSSYAMGFHPHFGFDKGRPTAFSGIDEFTHRRQQFIFSAAGLTVQDLLDELVLDIPHQRGGPFERGVLAGGLGTTLFYITAGRNARVSDISVMARTSSLSKSQLSLIFGSVAGLHAFRMSRDRHYSRFFAAPASGGGVKTGISISTR